MQGISPDNVLANPQVLPEVKKREYSDSNQGQDRQNGKNHECERASFLPLLRNRDSYDGDEQPEQIVTWILARLGGWSWLGFFHVHLWNIEQAKALASEDRALRMRQSSP